MFGRLLGELLGRTARGHETALWHYESAERARAEGRLDEVEAHYRRAIELDPNAVALNYNLGLLLQQLGDLSGAESFLKRTLDLQPDYQPAHSSFLCLGDFSTALTRREIYFRHVRWARAFADPLTEAAQPHAVPTESPRLRIGYVSADFRGHAAGRFVEPVLRHHARSRYEVFCYSNSAEPDDDMTRHLRSLADHWRDVAAMTNEALARRMRDDRIDILLDLSGHSPGNRLLAFARKPAPVQITWLGYLNTTGMQAMDYRLTDAVADPPGSEQWYRERLLRMRQPQWCYVPEAGPVKAPVPTPSRNTGNEPPIFACMTRFMKISDDAARLWARILQEAPGARLRIVDVPNHARAAALRRLFQEAGVAGRVDFLGTLRGNDYWRTIGESDIALDTFPYTGATTSCDCLWMGVPVVTLAGECGAARSATSLLAALDLSELSADTREGYVAAAVALGRDRRRLSALREELPRRMRASPLCDPIGFTLDLERLYETAWAQWQERAVSRG